MVFARSLLSLFTISITTAGVLANATSNDDDSHIFDYDVLQYIDPLVGSSDGGIMHHSLCLICVYEAV